MSNPLYKKLSSTIYELIGMYYPEKEYYRLDARIKELISVFNLNGEKDLLDLLSQPLSPSNRQVLIDTATNNETYFLRDNKPFDAMGKNIIPNILKEGRSHINIWSAGCSTGQEPYSIMMKTLEENPSLTPAQVKIDATDICHQALGVARNGVYSTLAVQRGLPINYLIKYFDKNEEEDTWKIKDFLRNSINWGEFNLFTGLFPLNKYDVIFCRNVIIYQTVENKKKILQNLFKSLKPGGRLLMGSGESLIGVDLDYKQESIENCMTFSKK